MKKNNKFILLILLSVVVLLFSFEYFGIVSVLPVAKYQENDKSINTQDLCEKIENTELKALCSSVVEKDDFEEGLVLLNEEGYPSEKYPWYDYPFYSFPEDYHNFPGGIEKMLIEGKIENSKEWCEEVYLSYTPLKEDYYFCRAFLENPNFCGKIYYQIGPSKGVCYQDAAFIWDDPDLCQKAENKDFCYIRIVLSRLEKSEE